MPRLRPVVRRAVIAVTAVAVAVVGWFALGSGSGAQASGAGTITGRILASDGSGIAGIWVQPFAALGSSWSGVDAKVVQTTTDGSYRMPVDAGDYRVCAYSQDESRAQGCAGGVSTAASGSTISVANGATVGAADITMPTASHISGTVIGQEGAPISGLLVSAYQSENGTWRIANTEFTSAKGNYDIGGLRPGTYRVSFADGGSSATYATSYWAGAGQPVAYSLETAADLTIDAPGRTLSGIDLSQSDKGVIAGTVTDFQGDPVVGVDIVVYAAADGGWSQVARASVSGTSYTVSGLSAGAYRVAFTNESANGPYQDEFNGGADAIDKAPDVNVSVGQKSVVDASLAYRAWVSPVPVLSGTPRVGGTIRVGHVDDWRPVASEISYVWTSDSGQVVAVTNAPALTITPALSGKRLKVRVHADSPQAGLAPAVVESAISRPVAAARFTRAARPHVSGYLKAGHRLWATGVGATPRAAQIEYQWYANGHRIRGAKHRTLKLTRSVRHRRISVHVTYRSTGYRAVTVGSGRTSRPVR